MLFFPKFGKKVLFFVFSIEKKLSVEQPVSFKQKLADLSLPKRSWLPEKLFTVRAIQLLFLTKVYTNFKNIKQTIKLEKNLLIFFSFPSLEKSQKEFKCLISITNKEMV